jgi:NADH:ubiquinone oxidoreductase subunit 6 (subunit J)
MSQATLISTLGVSLLLLAFIGSSAKIISQQNQVYWLLNLVGGAIATVGAWMVGAVPFVVLEAVWTVASLVGLIKLVRQQA